MARTVAQHRAVSLSPSVRRYPERSRRLRRLWRRSTRGTRAMAAALAPDALARLHPYLRMAREEWRGPWSIARRRICDYLVVQILDGRGRFELDGEAFAVGAGDVVWFPPLLPHAMRGDAPRTKVLWAHFDLVWSAARSPHVPLP